MSLEIGQIVDDKYRIVRLIGEGGMGAVYEGTNTHIHRRVAIKVLHQAAATSGEMVARFEREAQAAGRIGNDHILEVLDLGRLPGGDRYMVMEYLDGETLLERIQSHGRLEPAQLVPIALQFLSALSAAHAAGIIHRDLKPENIFVLKEKAGRRDFVKLIDFGVSKFVNLDPNAHRVTRAGAMIGTPCYLAPEQARGNAEVDVRSDVYAVGVILYEATTGRLPFEGETFNDLLFKIALTEAPSPRTFAPSLDEDFEQIVTKSMARDPAQRFQSVDLLSAALEDWADAHSVPVSLAPVRERRGSLPNLPNATPPSTPRIGARNEAVLETRVAPPEVIPLDLSFEEEGLEPTMIEELGGRRTTSDWARSQAPERPRSSSPRLLLTGGVIAAALVIGVTAIVITRSTSQSAASGLVPTASATEALGEARAATDVPSTGTTTAVEVDAATAPKASASGRESPRAPVATASAVAPGSHVARPPSSAAASVSSGKAKPTAKPAKPATDFGY